MKIPVFGSCPTTLNAEQQAARAVLMAFLGELNLEARALGRSDYPSELPLREVLVIARHCAGGLILGFEQFRATAGTWKRGLGQKNGERNWLRTKRFRFRPPGINWRQGYFLDLEYRY